MRATGIDHRWVTAASLAVLVLAVALWLKATNDRPRPAPDRTEFGLVGMAERLQAVGGQLHTRDDRDRFTLRVEVAA